MDEDRTPAWLPLVEASQRLGMSVDALRKRIRRGLVEARKGNDGKVVVLVAGTLTLASQGPDMASQGLADLDELAEAKTDVERWRSLAEERGAKLAAAEAVQAELRRALQREQARADRLETDARRSWWRRWLG